MPPGISRQPKACLGTCWWGSPLDVGMAGVDVVAVGHFDAFRVPESKLGLVPFGDGTQEWLQAVAHEVIQLARILRSPHGQRAHQSTHAPRVIGGQLPLLGPGCMPGRSEAMAHRRHDLTGSRQAVGDLFECQITVPGVNRGPAWVVAHQD